MPKSRAEIVQLLNDTLESTAESHPAAMAQVQEYINQTNIKRVSLIEDLERGVLYCIVMVLGARYMNKEVRAKLYPNVRSVILGIAGLFLLMIELVLLARIASMLPNETYGYAGIIFIMLFQFGIFMAWVERIRKKVPINELGIHRLCASCQYDLDGLQAEFFADIQIGPKLCPECGHAYPAIP